MIEAHQLTKRYGDTTAVHSLSFTITPGTANGFLGPNGAGKSTTMRLIMGLDRQTSGTVTVNGKPYRQHRFPQREVGALLDTKAVRPAHSHLRTMAATHNIKASRRSPDPDPVLAAEAFTLVVLTAAASLASVTAILTPGAAETQGACLSAQARLIVELSM